MADSSGMRSALREFFGKVSLQWWVVCHYRYCEVITESLQISHMLTAAGGQREQLGVRGEGGGVVVGGVGSFTVA